VIKELDKGRNEQKLTMISTWTLFSAELNKTVDGTIKPIDYKL